MGQWGSGGWGRCGSGECGSEAAGDGAVGNGAVRQRGSGGCGRCGSGGTLRSRRLSGTSFATIRCASPSATAVLPTPADHHQLMQHFWRPMRHRCTWLPQQHWVALRASAQYLHSPTDLFVTPNHGVKLTVPRRLTSSHLTQMGELGQSVGSSLTLVRSLPYFSRASNV